ncbi:sodium/calcium exchanger NCL2-like [Corylus avellana]|uniref:sodium/calcium exchanger NCL2-like n=1 Tax=Corylus avellana TaxID=13451 RepID=UPI00286B8466|nr:sodium/calcium exchanger NCL2-like [Corylus avellana]
MSSHLNLFFLILLLSGPTNGRHSSYDVVSDGGVQQVHASPYLALNSLSAAGSSCDETYGFLPCTTSVLGNLFLILVYGYFMFLAATYLSDGSELLLEILGTGIVGGLLLPILGAAPESLIILASGLSGTTAAAQSQVSVGMGLLAGSTVMLLTIIWGSCVIVGKCDLVDSKAVDSKDTKGYSLTESGISTDIWTCYTARIMAISVIPFVIVQIPLIFNSISWRRLAVLIGLIVSLLLLASYCLYQLYGAATMRNVLSLSVFLALVYIRGLPWDFTAEMLVILIVCVVMGALGSFRRTRYPLWTSILAILLYPFSLALVYVFHSVFGWS